MARFTRLFSAGLALATAASLSLVGCSQTKEAAQKTGEGMGEAAKQATTGMGEAAKNTATGAAQTALAPAVSPVIDLLKQGQADLKSGNLAAAVTAMGGFEALWSKASPVIQPLAGDKWPAVETAAKQVISTFGAGGSPDAAKAGTAITGLIGPLQALMAK